MKNAINLLAKHFASIRQMLSVEDREERQHLPLTGITSGDAAKRPRDTAIQLDTGNRYLQEDVAG